MCCDGRISSTTSANQKSFSTLQFMSKAAKILDKLNLSLQNIKCQSFVTAHVPLSLLSVISGAADKYFC